MYLTGKRKQQGTLKNETKWKQKLGSILALLSIFCFLQLFILGRSTIFAISKAKNSLFTIEHIKKCFKGVLLCSYNMYITDN